MIPSIPSTALFRAGGLLAVLAIIGWQQFSLKAKDQELTHLAGLVRMRDQVAEAQAKDLEFLSVQLTKQQEALRKCSAGTVPRKSLTRCQANLSACERRFSDAWVASSLMPSQSSPSAP